MLEVDRHKKVLSNTSLHQFDTLTMVAQGQYSPRSGVDTPSSSTLPWAPVLESEFPEVPDSHTTDLPFDDDCSDDPVAGEREEQQSIQLNIHAKPVDFISADRLPTNSVDTEQAGNFPCPDATKIMEYTAAYYPQILAHHALRKGTMACNAVDCKSTGDISTEDTTSKRGRSYYSCEDCSGGKIYCKECVVSRHEENPLHRIKTWNPATHRKETTSLYELGLTIKLIHENGADCETLTPTLRLTLKVIHTNGVHQLGYWRCGCYKHHKTTKARPAQLVANKLFPASHTDPLTAFTFDALNLFDVQNLESSMNVKQFCDSLHCIAPDNFKLSEQVGQF